MKKILITIALAAASVGAFAQGRVTLTNDPESLYTLAINPYYCLPPDAPLAGQPIPIGGPLPSGVVLEVGLYGGTTSTSLTLQTNVLLNPTGGGGGPGDGQPPVTHVHIDSAGMFGYFPGARVYFQVFVWDSAYATPQEATAGGSYEGQNNMFQMTPGTNLPYLNIETGDSTTWTAVGDESPLYVGAPAPTNGPPHIGSQPQSITVPASSITTFSVLAGGAVPLSFQWSKDALTLSDGQGISGALTPTLTLSNVTAADAGGYRVVVTNSYGSTNSAVATLTVFSASGGVVTNCTEAALRAAMAGGGVVTFACDGTITLAATITNVTDTVLDGSGHQMTISGGGSVQVFSVARNLTLIHLTISNGRTSDGANGSSFTNITGGSAEPGGGIYNASTLTRLRGFEGGERENAPKSRPRPKRSSLQGPSWPALRKR